MSSNRSNRSNRSAKNGNTGSKADQSQMRNKNNSSIQEQGRQTKNWSFTYNNYELDQIDHLEQMIRSYSKIYSFEKENPDKTPHLQGCLKLKERKRLTELKKIFWAHPKIHWDETRNVQKSIIYTQKDAKNSGDIYSKGILTEKQIFFELFELSCLFDYFEQTYDECVENKINEYKHTCDEIEDVSLVLNIQHWKLLNNLMYEAHDILLNDNRIEYYRDYIRLLEKKDDLEIESQKKMSKINVI